MLRLGWLVLVLLLSACDPSANQESANKFILKKGKLYFSHHELTLWQNKTIPYCELCSFNLYSKKMLPGAMLFREVNNQRGDLLFLVASNLRYGFSIQTGGGTHSVQIKEQEGSFSIDFDGGELIRLTLNQKQKISLGGLNYIMLLQKIDVETGALDLIFWQQLVQ